MKTKTYILINTEFAAMHQWATIPSDHPMQFLKDPHRHVFHVQIKKEVWNDDRAIEFIWFKQVVDKYIAERYKLPDGGLKNLGGKSCEMIAKELMDEFGADYVRVMEDAENGAEVIKIE